MKEEEDLETSIQFMYILNLNALPSLLVPSSYIVKRMIIINKEFQKYLIGSTAGTHPHWRACGFLYIITMEKKPKNAKKGKIKKRRARAIGRSHRLQRSILEIYKRENKREGIKIRNIYIYIRNKTWI